MNAHKPKRQRGIILTPKGLEKLQAARLELEVRENSGQRFTFQQLSDRTGLDIHTLAKVLDGKQGVDRRTIERFFIALNLNLNKIDYSPSYSNIHRKDWAEAPCIWKFYGRNSELTTLEQWLILERCQLVAILGMGGIGKTALGVKLAELVKNKFEIVIWRNLLEAPPLKSFLAKLIEFLSDGQVIESNFPESISDRISQLIGYLHSKRCLLIFDNVESILRADCPAGQYREGYESYGELFRRVAELTHISCLILIGREKPKEFAFLGREALSIRSLQLRGLSTLEAQKLLESNGLFGNNEEYKTLIESYGGNPLALKLVATTIENIFNGNVSEFIKQKTAPFGYFREILTQQLERLSEREKQIIYWLARNCYQISFEQIQNNNDLLLSPVELLEGLDSLMSRSLLEKNAGRFSLTPLFAKYITSDAIANYQVTAKPSHLQKIYRY